MSSPTITETTNDLFGKKEFITADLLENHHDVIVAEKYCSTSSSSSTKHNKRKNTTKKNRTRNTPPPPHLENHRHLADKVRTRRMIGLK